MPTPEEEEDVPSNQVSPGNDAATRRSKMMRRASSFQPASPTELKPMSSIKEAQTAAIERQTSNVEKLMITDKLKRPPKEFKLLDYVANPPISKGDALKTLDKLAE